MIISANFTENAIAVMKGFPKGASSYMNGFPKGVEVDNFWWFFKYCLQQLSGPVLIDISGFQNHFVTVLVAFIIRSAKGMWVRKQQWPSGKSRQISWCFHGSERKKDKLFLRQTRQNLKNKHKLPHKSTDLKSYSVNNNAKPHDTVPLIWC